MIRPGMKIAEAILQLTKGFRKMMGRDPDGLEKIKIQQEAVKRIEEVNKVVDMEGNVIDTSKGIMGGKQIQDSPEFGAKIRETYDKAKGPGKGQEMVDALKSPGAKKSYKIIEDQLGVKLYGDETFDEILEIQKTGKHPRGEPKRSMVKDAVDNASPGFVKGDRKYNAQLVAEDLANKKFGKEFYDLDQRQQMDLYDEALEGYDELTRGMPDPEDFAQGGRAGFKIGSIDKARRAFLKTVGAAGAGITALKTGLLGLGKEAAPAVETVKETVTGAPQYFFDLVAKIKAFGKQSKVGPQERVNEFSYTGKNGDDYTLTEDIGTGEIQVVKDKTGVGSYGDKTFDTINDRTVLEYKPGKSLADESTQGTPADEFEVYKVEFDQDGTMAGADAIDEIVQKEIIEEATKSAPPIKKAGGGIARMLGE
jgi:hypothetical protein